MQNAKWHLATGLTTHSIGSSVMRAWVIRSNRWLIAGAAIIAACATGDPAHSQNMFTLIESSSLKIQVMVEGGRAWCADNLRLRMVVAPDSPARGNPAAIAAFMNRIGGPISADCKAAETARLTLTGDGASDRTYIAFSMAGWLFVNKSAAPSASASNIAANEALTWGLIADLLQHYADAARWYQVAADQGNAKAKLRLSLLYHNGTGVRHDDVQAMHLARSAADQGDSDSQYNVGIMYENGWGVPPNRAAALQWLRLAAKNGSQDAQVALNQYAQGQANAMLDALGSIFSSDDGPTPGSAQDTANRERQLRWMRQGTVFDPYKPADPYK